MLTNQQPASCTQQKRMVFVKITQKPSDMLQSQKTDSVAICYAFTNTADNSGRIALDSVILLITNALFSHCNWIISININQPTVAKPICSTKCFTRKTTYTGVQVVKHKWCQKQQQQRRQQGRHKELGILTVVWWNARNVAGSIVNKESNHRHCLAKTHLIWTTCTTHAVLLYSTDYSTQVSK